MLEARVQLEDLVHRECLVFRVQQVLLEVLDLEAQMEILGPQGLVVHGVVKERPDKVVQGVTQVLLETLVL